MLGYQIDDGIGITDRDVHGEVFTKQSKAMRHNGESIVSIVNPLVFIVALQA